MALALLAAAFYWFAWRPSQIRKDCAAEASLVVKNAPFDPVTFRDPTARQRLIEQKYTECLHRAGL